MTFQWDKYLDLACYLSKQTDCIPDDEACYRTSVSRAYYAALGVVHIYLQNVDGISPFKTDTHRKIREYLLNSHNKTRRLIANQLKVFHQNRIEVDYHNSLKEKPVNSASKSIALSRKIIQEVRKLYNEKSR